MQISQTGGQQYSDTSIFLTAKRLNLKLKTRPKQLLGYRLLAFVLLGVTSIDLDPSSASKHCTVF
jgi:hypothetical protein